MNVLGSAESFSSFSDFVKGIRGSRCVAAIVDAAEDLPEIKVELLSLCPYGEIKSCPDCYKSCPPKVAMATFTKRDVFQNSPNNCEIFWLLCEKFCGK